MERHQNVKASYLRSDSGAVQTVQVLRMPDPARSLQMFAKEAEEVFAEDAFDVGGGVAAMGKKCVELCNVGDAVEVERRLLGAESAIEVGADADVACVADELADVVNVVADFLDAEAELLRRGAFVRPAMDHHDCIECHADDSAACDEFADLFIGELAVPVCERTAVMMARPDGAAEMIQRVAHGFVAEVRDIEDDAEPLHFLQQFAAPRRERPFVVRAVAVDSRPVMHGAERDESVRA